MTFHKSATQSATLAATGILAPHQFAPALRPDL